MHYILKSYFFIYNPIFYIYTLYSCIANIYISLIYNYICTGTLSRSMLQFLQSSFGLLSFGSFFYFCFFAFSAESFLVGPLSFSPPSKEGSSWREKWFQIRSEERKKDALRNPVSAATTSFPAASFTAGLWGFCLFCWLLMRPVAAELTGRHLVLSSPLLPHLSNIVVLAAMSSWHWEGRSVQIFF